MLGIRVERPRGVYDVLGSLPAAAVMAFVALRLAGALTWSWWWVLSPLWIGALALALLAGALAILWCLGRWPVLVADLFRARGRG